MALRCPPLPDPRVDLARAPRCAGSCYERGVGQDASGGRSARSISGRCKISRNLRKRLECGAAIGPPGRRLGRAGEGRSKEVDGKYEGVVPQRGVAFSSHSCQHSFFLLPEKQTQFFSPMAHNPAHARSLAVTFPGNCTFQMVRSDAMQAAVFLAKLLGWGCVCAVPQ